MEDAAMATGYTGRQGLATANQQALAFYPFTPPSDKPATM
jgi:hypothetical protein